MGKSGVSVNKAVLNDIRNRTPAQISAAVRSMAFDGERDVKQSFGTSPSQPGDPPGVDTGALRSSIHAEQISEYQWGIYTGVDYAAHLEFGTSKMAARPYMLPMAMRLQSRAKSYFQDIIP